MRIFIVLIFLIVSTGFMMSQNKYEPSRGSQLVSSIQCDTAKNIEAKYNLRPSGSGVSMPGGPIRKIAICFDASSSDTKDQLRKLLIETAEQLLNNVSLNDEIQEHLYERPFTIKNVQIIIYNYGEKRESLYDPQICVADITKGILTYNTKENNSIGYKNEFEETYEDALKLIGR